MWDKLSMRDKVNYIKLAVDSGIADMSSIRETYNDYYKTNRFDDGGFAILNDDPQTRLERDNTTVQYIDPNQVEQTHKDYISNQDNWFNPNEDNKSFWKGEVYGSGDTFTQRIPTPVSLNTSYSDLSDNYVGRYDDLNSAPNTYTTRQLSPEEVQRYKRYNLAESQALEEKRNKEAQQMMLDNYTKYGQFTIPTSELTSTRGTTPFENYMNTKIANNKEYSDRYWQEFSKLINKEGDAIAGFSNYIDDRLNTYTGGAWHLLSPSHDIGMIREALSGQGLDAFNPFNSNSAYWDNSGIFSEEFTEKHPFIAGVTNAGIDLYGANKAIKGIKNIENSNIGRGVSTLESMGRKIRSKVDPRPFITSTMRDFPSFYHQGPGRFISDLMYPKRTIRAIKDHNYIPLLSEQEKADFIKYLNNEVNKRFRPAARSRYSKRKRILEDEGYNIIDGDPTTDIENIPIHFDLTGKLIKNHDMAPWAAGYYDNGKIVISINKGDTQPNVYRNVSYILGDTAHELDHLVQNKLGDSLPLVRDATSTRPLMKRVPIYEGDGVYFSSPKYDSSRPYSEYEYPTFFDKLTDRTKKQAKRAKPWHNNPGEVQSETATFIDKTNDIGKTFKELDKDAADKIVKKIARRFYISTDNAREILTRASNAGYLANGGFISTDFTNKDGLTGMMKARLALASHFGNPTARRITNYDTRSYTFPNGERGNVYLGSYDNLVTPQIQDINGNLHFIDNPWSPENRRRSYSQSIVFDRPYDAEYFGEHYKEIAPMMNLYQGGTSRRTK